MHLYLYYKNRIHMTMEEEKDMFPSLAVLLLEEEDKKEQGEEENPNLVKVIKDITGYEFHDPILLLQAFTHHSYEEDCSSLHRLAYLGDAVLDFLIAKEHYFSYPDLDPGKLTKLRAANVDNEKLARMALRYGLEKFLKHNIFILEGQIEEFKVAIMDYPLHSGGLVKAPKVLADVFEALVGAIFIDSNSSMDTTWEITKKLLEPIITPATLPTHPVSQLQERCQKKGFKWAFEDRLWKETGKMTCVVDELVIGKGKDPAKRAVAKTKAALDVLSRIGGK